MDHESLMQLDLACGDVVVLLEAVCSSGEELPMKKLKTLVENCNSMKDTIRRCQHLNLKEEDTLNRMMFIHTKDRMGLM